MTVRLRWGDQILAGDTAEGFVCAPTDLMAKSLLPEQSAWRVHTQPTAAEANQRQHADEYGQMVLNSGTFCSWTRLRQSRNSSENSCTQSDFTVLTIFHRMHIHKCWSLEAQVEFLFYISHPARLMSSPAASAHRSVQSGRPTSSQRAPTRLITKFIAT